MDGYQQLEKEETIMLPRKTNSYQEWAEALYQYTKSHELQAELPYWEKVIHTKVSKLPRDKESTSLLMKDMVEIPIEFSQKETRQLLTDVHQAYHTEVTDFLLAALGLTLQEWTGQARIAVNLEGHGREQIDDQIDVTRTIGWFTSMFPLILQIPDHSVSQVIKTVKETMRSVPRKGIGYGILKYLARDPKLASDFRPEICFNYLG